MLVQLTPEDTGARAAAVKDLRAGGLAQGNKTSTSQRMVPCGSRLNTRRRYVLVSLDTPGVSRENRSAQMRGQMSVRDECSTTLFGVAVQARQRLCWPVPRHGEAGALRHKGYVAQLVRARHS